MFDENKLNDICEMEKTLISCFKNQLHDINSMDTKEAGEVADIIKDFSEVEKNLREAEYYKLVSEAMDEASEDAYGRSKRGYRPMSQEKYMRDYIDNPNEFKDKMHNDYPEYGVAYDNYKTAKRNYTETHSEYDKKSMEKNAEQHFDNAMMTIKEIWKDLEPTQKARMKNELTSLLGNM